MKKIIFFTIIFLISLLAVCTVFAGYQVKDFHEMTGTIVDKDIGGVSIDYLIDINGTLCFLSCHHQPFEEFYIGDNVTMNGTIDKDSIEFLNLQDFDGKYDGEELPNLVLNNIVENQHTYGQMRLTSDIDNQYYKQLQ